MNFATIDEVRDHTERAFDSNQITTKKAREIFDSQVSDVNRKLEAITEANLATQRALCQSDDIVRVQGIAAERLGFVPLNFEQIIRMMSPAPLRSIGFDVVDNANCCRSGSAVPFFDVDYRNMHLDYMRNMYEWFLPSPFDEPNTGPEKYFSETEKRYRCKGFMAPVGFFRTGSWLSRGPTFVFTRLNDLIREIPYGAILRVQEAKKTGLFNCFNIMTPIDQTNIKDKRAPASVDPVIVGTIIAQDHPNGAVPQHLHFFIAKWD